MATDFEMDTLLLLERYAMACRFFGKDAQAEAAEHRANAMRQAIWARLKERN